MRAEEGLTEQVALERQVSEARAAGGAAAVLDLGALRKPTPPTSKVVLKLIQVGPVWQLLGSDSPDTIDAQAALVATGPANTYPLIQALVADAQQTAAARAGR